MGRPPIGKRAMTGTERQRRYGGQGSRSSNTAPKALQTRVRQLEADQAALIAAMGKLLAAMSQRSAGRAKRSGFDAAVREFRAVLARLQHDPASRPDKGLDGRRFELTVTGYRRQMFWLQDLDSNEVVGPLVPVHRTKAPTGSRAKAQTKKIQSTSPVARVATWIRLRCPVPRP